MTNIELFKMVLVFYVFLTLFCGVMLGTTVKYDTLKQNIKSVVDMGASPLQCISVMALPLWIIGLTTSFIIKKTLNLFKGTNQ